MNALAQAIEDARRAVGKAAKDFLPDRCRVAKPDAPETDAYGVTAEAPVDGEQMVPCSYKATGVSRVALAGGRQTTATHVLTLPANTEVEAGYSLVVHERGLVPELTFKVEGRLDESTDLLLKVAATLQR